MRGLHLGILPFSLVLLSGCVVVPIGDLLRPPEIRETTVIPAEGFFTRARVAIIDISGVLVTGPRRSLLRTRPGTVPEVRAMLTRAKADRRVKALILRIDSPGGGVTASDILHREILRWKEETGRPIVACLVDTAASGGYYVATAADEIIAHPTSTTGAIGVILRTFDLSGLLGKIGVRPEVIRSGDKKDMASIWRAMTPEEREILQGIIGGLHDRFVGVVAEGRRIPREKVRPLADGRIFSAPEALEKGLVDRLGYMEDAVARAKALAGIEDARVIRYTRGGGGGDLYARIGRPSPSAARVSLELPEALSGGGPFFLYYWAPGLGAQ